MGNFIVILVICFITLVILMETHHNMILIEENILIHKEYTNFKENNLKNYKDSPSNFKTDYPYSIFEGKHLCNNEYSISLSELNTEGTFSNPDQIKEDFSMHSEKYKNLYFSIYCGIWSSQLFILIYIIFILVAPYKIYRRSMKKQIIKLVQLIIIYDLINTWKLHLLLTTSYLQAPFTIFDFDDCIKSSNQGEVQIAYLLKTWGICVFGIGVLFIVIYILKLCFGFWLILVIVGEERKHKSSCILFYIIIQTSIFVEIFTRYIYFEDYVDKYSSKENDLLRAIIRELLLFHIIVGWGLLALASFISLCTRRAYPTLESYINIKPRPSNAGEIFFEGVKCKFCNICLEGLEDQDVVKLVQCNHIFHLRCLKEWRIYSELCPICRQVMP